MAADKTIFELPELTEAILNSGLDIGFVAQVEGYTMDFQVPYDLLVQVIGAKQIVYGGSTNPSSPTGVIGDLYFQTNGKVYQKEAGGWVLKSTIGNGNTRPEFRVAFTSSTGPVISWQSAIPPGSTQTYFQLFGNYVEAFVYRTDFGLPLGQPYTWTLDGSNNVDVVTFAFGDTATGYIKFG